LLVLTTARGGQELTAGRLMSKPRRAGPERSKSTQERKLPGAFEGESVTRRRFVTGTAYAAGAIAGTALTVPLVGFATAPLFDRAPGLWQEIGPLSRFTESRYVPVTITIEPGVGEAGRSLAYVRKHNRELDGPVKDRYDRVIAISSRCVHVGCPVRLVAAAGSFVCPCHGGVYDIRGHRTGGPPPRPLDRFYTLIRDGQVLLGPRFSVNSELKRFAPRDPGQPLDGIGPFLYPPRFSTPHAPPGATS
jgi:menaquinol-cytochrome c reductase iron-sulfur subunit